MGLSDIPAEMRLLILSELLVLAEPIHFRADFGPSLPSLLRPQKYGLCPAVLRVSKMMHEEGIPLLYSENRFCFPEVYVGMPSIAISAHIRPFLDQVGSCAELLRHICIPFPEFDYRQRAKTALHHTHIENAELIGNTCTGLETLELLVAPEYDNYILGDPEDAAESWDAMEACYNAIPSIHNIVVHFEIYPFEEPSDDITQRVQKCGWTVQITRLQAKKWYSDDGRVVFDNEDDCRAYDEEQFRWEWQAEEAAEEAWWIEEYHRRRRDPYWKNDSDYD